MAKQDDYIKTALRLPRDVHARLLEASERSAKSMNAEIVERLSGSFEPYAASDVALLPAAKAAIEEMAIKHDLSIQEALSIAVLAGVESNATVVYVRAGPGMTRTDHVELLQRIGEDAPQDAPWIYESVARPSPAEIFEDAVNGPLSDDPKVLAEQARRRPSEPVVWLMLAQHEEGEKNFHAAMEYALKVLALSPSGSPMSRSAQGLLDRCRAAMGTDAAQVTRDSTAMLKGFLAEPGKKAVPAAKSAQRRLKLKDPNKP